MAKVCQHGFAPDQCMICRTLGTKPTPPAVTSVGGALPTSPDPSWSPANRAPSHVPERRSITAHVVMVIAALLAIGAVAWLLAGAVFAILHFLELIVVAGVAGWAGYRLGHYRGRREPR